MDLRKGYPDDLENAINETRYELLPAKRLHPGEFKNFHEAYAVILEEVDELWEEIKKRDHDKEKIRVEAKQVAAMCLRLMCELTNDDQ